MADLSMKYLLFGEDRSASKAIKGVADTAQQSGRTFDGVSKAWAAGAALAGAAVVKFGIDSVSAASDQNEVLSKSSIIFGQNADEIEAWGDTADTKMGLSKTAALQAASSFGDMFLQLGFTGDAATDMSQSVVQLSADLGSFNNLPTAEVTDMVSAAFRGEYDSLQRLVPNINAARVETQALAMTGKTNAAQLTAQEKAAATLAIITKDSARAQGDFARTSDGLANSQKILAAEFANAQAELGQRLLPAVNAVVHALTGGIGVVTGTVDAVASMPAPILAATAAFAAFHLLNGPVTGFMGRVTSQARPMTDSLKLAGMYAREAGGGFAGLKAGLSAMSGGLTAGQVAANGLKGAGSALMGLAGGPWGLAITGLTFAITGFITAQQNAKAAAEDLAATFDKVTGAATEASKVKVRDALMGDLSQADQKLLSDLGISFTEGAAAAMAGGQALADYKDKVIQLRSGHMEAFSAAEGYISSLQNQSEVSHDAAAGAQVLAKETKAAGTAADTAADSGPRLGSALGNVAKTAGGLTVDMQALNGELSEFYGRNISAAEAAIQYESALDDASQAVKDNGKTLDVNTAKGRANKSALIDMAKAADDQTRATLKSGGSLKTAGDQADKARRDFIKVAMQMNGGNRRAAEDMANKFGLTKDSVQRLNGEINKTPKAKKTDINVPTAKPRGQIASIRSEMATLRGRNLYVSVTSNVWGAVSSIRSALAGIGGSIGRNAKGTSNWRGGLTWVGEEGPELVNLPAGSAVYDNRTSMAMSAPTVGGSSSASAAGSTQPLVVQLVLDGRVVQQSLLKLKRTTGNAALGLA